MKYATIASRKNRGTAYVIADLDDFFGGRRSWSSLSSTRFSGSRGAIKGGTSIIRRSERDKTGLSGEVDEG